MVDGHGSSDAPSPRPWQRAAAQVVVGSLEVPTMSDEDHHHLSRVLRLQAGDEVCATDGAGGWRSCEFTGARELATRDEPRHEPPARYEVTVGFALVKGAKPELVVQKLTELGVDRIVAMSAQRSVVRWDERRAAKHLERLRRVAREACGQCRRLYLPSIGLVSEDDDDDGAASRFVGLPTVSEMRSQATVLADVGGRSMRRTDRTVLIGPEGGWTSQERAGADTVGLGVNVLRAETAAIAAGVALTALRDGWLTAG